VSKPLAARLNERKIPLLIVLVFIPLFMFYLGVPSFWEEDESIYVDITREMILRHDYVSTFFNYQPRFDKPPLNFWITAVFYKLFGMNEFTSRLASNIFGFLGLILVYLFGKKLFNRRSGWLAALILGTSFLYFIETQMAIIDTTLTFFITLTLYWFYQGYFERQPRFLVFMGIPLGLGILTKGPVALLLPAAIGMMTGLSEIFKKRENWRSLFNWRILAAFAIAFAICLPWYLAMWSRHGMAFLDAHFGYHMIRRFSTAIEGHGGGWYYYLYYVILLFIAFLPWSFGITGSISAVIKKLTDSKYFFLFSWSIVIFGFFTIAQTKLPGYILPLLPPVALMMGSWWDGLFDESKSNSHFWWGNAIQCLIALLFVALIIYKKSELPAGYESTVGIFVALPVSLLVTAIVLLFTYLYTKSYRLPFKISFGISYIFWAVFLMSLVPIIEDFKPSKYLAAAANRYLTDKDTIISTIPEPKSAVFYTRHQVILSGDNARLAGLLQGKGRVFAMVGKKNLDYLKEQKVGFILLKQHGSGYLITNREVR
jgi:4-amino-4-deoxy-L-arabinose transferase-like glycosyltransferase